MLNRNGVLANSGALVAYHILNVYRLVALNVVTIHCTRSAHDCILPCCRISHSVDVFRFVIILQFFETVELNMARECARFKSRRDPSRWDGQAKAQSLTDLVPSACQVQISP